jgi:hypothetical protein
VPIAVGVKENTQEDPDDVGPSADLLDAAASGNYTGVTFHALGDPERSRWM